MCDVWVLLRYIPQSPLVPSGKKLYNHFSDGENEVILPGLSSSAIIPCNPGSHNHPLRSSFDHYVCYLISTSHPLLLFNCLPASTPCLSCPSATLASLLLTMQIYCRLLCLGFSAAFDSGLPYTIYIQSPDERSVRQ